MNKSAGLLMYRIRDDELELFLAHMGGPYFKNKDNGYWTIPKGLIENNEPIKEAAKREFQEETGIVSEEPMIDLGEIKQKGGKIVYAWAFDYNGPPEIEIKSNSFEIEWPPKSGMKKTFPEIDNAQFFKEEEARRKINPAQLPFIDRLKEQL
jgi:predicted NUDIX family NTP pyrophosphohydrolase